jgi:hypothetical protein
MLPQMSTLLRDLVSIATKWLTRAMEFGCRNIVAIMQLPCILLQYTGYIATKHVLIMTKLNRGNMHSLLPQRWKWWQYCILLQRNVVVAIKIVAIDRISCSGWGGERQHARISGVRGGNGQRKGAVARATGQNWASRFKRSTITSLSHRRTRRPTMIPSWWWPQQCSSMSTLWG